MNYKLQCMNKAVAFDAHQRWAGFTIQLDSALLCFDMSPDQLAVIQQHTRAHTVELSRYDIRKIKQYYGINDYRN